MGIKLLSTVYYVRPYAVDFISYISTEGCGKSRSLAKSKGFFFKRKNQKDFFLDLEKPLNAVISIVKGYQLSLVASERNSYNYNKKLKLLNS